MFDFKKLIEISFEEYDDFKIIQETLTRIGIASRKDNTLFQSCHILHKQGRYYITHFKEMFAIDGKVTDISDNDIQRRNTIAKLLEDWGLLEILNPDIFGPSELAPIQQIKILPHKEAVNWNLVAKYNIGKKFGR